MNWLKRLSRGFGYLTLDPSPRLRRLREEAETQVTGRGWGPFGPLPPLPDSAYPPGAVPLDCSGIPVRQLVTVTCPRCGENFPAAALSTVALEIERHREKHAATEKAG